MNSGLINTESNRLKKYLEVFCWITLKKVQKPRKLHNFFCINKEKIFYVPTDLYLCAI